MTWVYQGQSFTAENVEDDMVGFVYCITNQVTSKKYIGKKFFFRTIVRQPLKGKTKKRKSIVQSDWEVYASSSDAVKEQVETLGLQSFQREIIEICYSKGMLSYLEAKYQFDLNVLFDDAYQNGIIQLRVNRKHVSKEEWLQRTLKSS